MSDMTAALVASGLDPGRIRHRAVRRPQPYQSRHRRPASDTTHPPAGAPGAGPTVTFARSGSSVPFDPRMRSLLEFAEACDVPTRWSCRTGVCHTCSTPLLTGR